MEYSGRTTCHSSKINDESWKETPNEGMECLQKEMVFHVQLSNCPVEVEKEVRQLWRDMEFRNDNYIYKWDDSDEERDENGVSCDSEAYPIIAEYLRSRGVTKCLIHWWW